MSSENITIAALGRPFTLGMLYDARKDVVFPGMNLWDGSTLTKHTTTATQKSSSFEITSSDTIESKSSLLDVNASLKASFLCGLIEVGGSANYMKDTKKFKNQSRVTFQYHATTHFRQLSVPQSETIQPGVLEKTPATHVVTGIVYGANAFFVFDSEKLEANDVQNIQGSMEAVIKKIPFVDIEASASVKLTNEEKALTNKFSCKFYGDLVLRSNPSTFEEAVKTYAQLPQELGSNGENSVPLKVFLMPLKLLRPESPELKAAVSVGLVRKVQDTLQDVREMKMRSNDSLEDPVIKKLPQVKSTLKRFQNLCDDYETSLKKTLATKIPLIRDGKENESSLETVFNGRSKSPFSHANLDNWLDQKEREINIIKSCVNLMTRAKIVQSESDLDREAFAPGVEHVVCFVFTCLECDDPNLDTMMDFLDSKPLTNTKKDLWYYSSEVIAKIREKAKFAEDLAQKLQNIPRFVFLVAAIDNHEYTGATVYHYKEGIRVTEDFALAGNLPPEEITDRNALIWYATDLNLDPNTVNNYLTLSDWNKRVTSGSGWNHYPDHPQRFVFQTQVLCKESLTGCHYWEIEWTNSLKENVYIAAAYKSIERNVMDQWAGFGANDKSWALGRTTDPSRIRGWHNNSYWQLTFPHEGIDKIGVFLDWPAGTLTFYSVTGNTLECLWTISQRFSEALVPGLWVYHSGNSAYLCPIK